jgi:hypothetical protein
MLATQQVLKAPDSGLLSHMNSIASFLHRKENCWSGSESPKSAFRNYTLARVCCQVGLRVLKPVL